MHTSLIAIVAFAAVAFVAGPASASSLTVNGMRATQDASLGNGIAVFNRTGKTNADFWCAAGDYARRRLRAPNGAGLTLARPKGAAGGPSGQASVGFVLSAAPTGQSLTASVTEVGNSRTVAAAEALCLSVNKRRDRD